MPPRRSSRAASAKPTSKAAPETTAEKPAVKPRSQPARKRAASPDRNEAPAPKRTRTAPPSKKAEDAPPKKPRSRAPSVTKAQPPAKRGRAKLDAIPEAAETKEEKEKAPKQKKEPKEKPAPIPQSRPYFNPLPTPPQRQRPGLTLWAWGAGNFGQFGMGPDVLDELTKPKRNPWVEEQIEEGTFGEEGAGLESIAAGGLHTLFTDEKGTVWSCGVNDNAALGRITNNIPDPNNPGSFLDVDELTSWPRPVQALLDESFRAVQIAAGDNIGAAVSDQGEFRVWGTYRGAEGALGFAEGTDKQDLPISILNLSHKPGDYEKVTSIAAGNNHVIVVTTHGNLYTFGAGEQGQLGRKIIERRKIHGTNPEKISLGTRSRKAVTTGAGSYHSFAIDDRGDVWGWGLNNVGQTGTGWSSPDDDNSVLLPQKVEALSVENLHSDRVVQVVGGEHHSLFLTESGKVYACGRMESGQLGLDDDHPAIVEWKKEYAERFDGEVAKFLPTPTLVTFPDPDDPVEQISCGLHNNAVVTRGGALYTWGQGTQGELGFPDVEVRTPRVVVRKDGGSWFAAAVSCGGQHTLGLFRKK
ncbi:RCC1/BLIP-II [Macrolepiota fuliginosa MF-IS2]|uniref:RCC1/BLIP-II n=1 Tax=Macrolepiota fuliginosa MF-IS2 TaxID=1400762 RepID=A0A9P5XEZ4_9AGAR|nr:RCC1/BLIP-II [Macrolepiota fuliginosa MF-IS2]